jgi:hypothetical protein
MKAELGRDASTLIAHIDAAYLAIEQWRTYLDNLKLELYELTDGADEIEFEGELIARTVMVRNRGRFDRARLHKEYPAIHDAYWLDGQGESARFSWRPIARGGKVDYR